MRLIKPAYLSHGTNGASNAIYSLDFQPARPAGADRYRLATGGGDSTVKLWDVSRLLDEGAGLEESLLATFEYHSKSVNACRWSKDGTLLASGSDDSYVIIYCYTHNAAVSQLFGSESVKSKESWSRQWTLHGHKMDVLDLDWSPSNLLASASIDNTILIWDIPAWNPDQYPGNAQSGGVLTPFRILNGHSSFVKGVAFDPIGRHLASSGSDNKVVVWNTETWTISKEITEPFEGSVDTSIFRRTSWAPDGGSLCISAAVKNFKPVGMVLKRSTWIDTADFVGHDAPTTCARFCNHLIDVSSNAEAEAVSQPCYIVALGDQEGVLSLWAANRPLPVIVVRDLFTDAIVDLSWCSLPANSVKSSKIVTADTGVAMVLGVSSLDGCLALVVFDPQQKKARNSSTLDSGENNQMHYTDEIAAPCEQRKTTDAIHRPSRTFGSCLFGKILTEQALERHFLSMYGQTRSDLINFSSLASRRPPTSSLRMSAEVRAEFSEAIGLAAAPVVRRSTVPLAPSCMEYTQIRSSTVSQHTTRLPSSPTVSNSSVPAVVTKNPPVAPSSSINSSMAAQLQVVSARPRDGKKRITPMVVGEAKNQVHSTQLHSNKTADHSPSVPIVVYQEDGVHDMDPPSKIPRLADSSNWGGDPSRNAASSTSPPATRNPSTAGPQSMPSGSLAQPVAAPSLSPAAAVTSIGFLSGPARGGAMVSSVPLRPTDNSTPQPNGAVLQYVIKTDEIISRCIIPSARHNIEGTSFEIDVSQGPRFYSDCKIQVRPISCSDTLTNAFGTSDINRFGCSAMSVVSLRQQGSLLNLNVWSVLVPSRITVGNAISFSGSSGSSHEGVLVLGSPDGALYILSLSSGIKLYPTLSLGAPVVSIMCLRTTPLEPDTSVHYCMAACSDGEIIVWRLDCVGYADEVRDERALRRDAVVKQGQIFAGLTLKYKTNIRPVIQSMRQANSVSDSEFVVKIDKLMLATGDKLQTESSSSDIGEMALVAVVHAAGAIGGDWHVFRYIPDAGAWTRVADMKYIFSRYNSTPRVSSGSSQTLSMITERSMPLESLPVLKSTLDLSDITNAAKILQRQKIQEQLTAQTTACPNDLLNNDGSRSCAIRSITDWGVMVSLCHVEEKLSSFFFEIALQQRSSKRADADTIKHLTANRERSGINLNQQRRDIGFWVGEWVQLSCQTGAIESVKRLSEQLLSLSRRPNYDGDRGSRSHLDISSAATEHSSAWTLSSNDDALQLLHDVVLPRLGQVATATNDLELLSLLQLIVDTKLILRES